MVFLMWKNLQRLLDRIESRLALWSIIAGSGVVGGLTAFVAGITDWMRPYAPFSWWAAGMGGALVTAFLAWGIALFRNALIRGSAVKKWQRQVDQINPLDPEFTRRRIRLADLMHPVRKEIKNKRFIDCELIGPANIALIDHVNMNGTGFIGCDIIVANPNTQILTVAPLRNITVLDGTIENCTIFIPESMVPIFRELGVSFASFTRDEATPLQSATGAGGKTPL